MSCACASWKRRSASGSVSWSALTWIWVALARASITWVRTSRSCCAIAFDRLDQVGNEIGAALILVLHLAPGRLGLLLERRDRIDAAAGEQEGDADQQPAWKSQGVGGKSCHRVSAPMWLAGVNALTISNPQGDTPVSIRSSPPWANPQANGTRTVGRGRASHGTQEQRPHPEPRPRAGGIGSARSAIACA